MKTHILQLESFDDVISARDKMGGSKAPRIVLVWPKRGRILRRRVDLVILQRYAAQLGAQVALVTRDPEVIDNAKSVGMAVFQSVNRARTVTWRRSRRRRIALGERKGYGVLAKMRRYTHEATQPLKEYALTRILSFVVGVLAVLALVAFLLPGARVTLAPEEQTQQMDIAVRASGDIGAPNLSGGLPAQEMSVVVEAEGEAVSTGRVAVPDRAAQGVVQFTNLSDEAVNVPAGTVVQTLERPAQRFATAHAVTVPAGVGQTSIVTVIAEAAGETGNVAPGAVAAIENQIGANLSVTNVEAFSGGSSQVGPAPSEDDYRALREKMTKDLLNKAGEALRTRLSSGDVLIDPSLVVIRVEEETQDPPPGSPSDRLHLKLRVEMSARVVTYTDLTGVALAALNANLPQGFAPLDETLTVESLSLPQWNAGETARWMIRAQRSIRADWNDNAVIRRITGSHPADAVQRLSADFRLRRAPMIELQPAWWARLPFLPFRIEVVVE